MPASNAYVFFDCHGFRKTNAARAFFLGVFLAIGAAVAGAVRGGASSAWFFGGLGEFGLDDDWSDM